MAQWCLLLSAAAQLYATPCWIASCYAVQVFRKRWHFDTLKEYFFKQQATVPLCCLSADKKIPILSCIPWGGSLISLSLLSFIYHLSLLSLTPTLLLLSSLRPASPRLLSCENDLIWIWWRGDDFVNWLWGNIFLSGCMWNHTSSAKTDRAQTPDVSITLHLSVCILKLNTTYWLVELVGGHYAAWESCSKCLREDEPTLQDSFLSGESKQVLIREITWRLKRRRTDGKRISLSVPPGICMEMQELIQIQPIPIIFHSL